jgi:hypothetical protein
MQAKGNVIYCKTVEDQVLQEMRHKVQCHIHTSAKSLLVCEVFEAFQHQ